MRGGREENQDLQQSLWAYDLETEVHRLHHFEDDVLDVNLRGEVRQQDGDDHRLVVHRRLPDRVAPEDVQPGDLYTEEEQAAEEDIVHQHPA